MLQESVSKNDTVFESLLFSFIEVAKLFERPTSIAHNSGSVTDRCLRVAWGYERQRDRQQHIRESLSLSALLNAVTEVCSLYTWCHKALVISMFHAKCILRWSIIDRPFRWEIRRWTGRPFTFFEKMSRRHRILWSSFESIT